MPSTPVSTSTSPMRRTILRTQAGVSSHLERRHAAIALDDKERPLFQPPAAHQQTMDRSDVFNRHLALSTNCAPPLPVSMSRRSIGRWGVREKGTNLRSWSRCSPGVRRTFWRLWSAANSKVFASCPTGVTLLECHSRGRAVYFDGGGGSVGGAGAALERARRGHKPRSVCCERIA